MRISGWSSDVCSSDLLLTSPNRGLAEEARSTSAASYAAAVARLQMAARRIVGFWQEFDIVLTPTLALPPVPIGWQEKGTNGAPEQQIGRAACRDRGWESGGNLEVPVSLKKKKK